MTVLLDGQDRRTSADIVFESLYDDIASLRLLPGTKMSEVDVAQRFGVSRQPVRDAFSRLGNLGLLLIRPQKATEVQRFSDEAIRTARFVRCAVEIEVCAKAVRNWSVRAGEALEQNLARQESAVADDNLDAFHELDFEFHRLLCEIGGVSFAFNVILENKEQVDRLCVLSMMDKDTMAQLVADHREIADRLQDRDAEGMVTAMRMHLGRLDTTIARVRAEHPDYFV